MTTVNHAVRELKEIIQSDAVDRLGAFAKENSTLCKLAFLTGSFARGKADTRLPNVNVYFVSSEGNAELLRIKLSNEIWQLRGALRKSHSLGLKVDCHPYTVAYHGDLRVSRPYVTLTTKVLDGSVGVDRFSLPPTIGMGWIAAYRVLWGDESVLQPLRISVRPDMDWFHAVYEALSRYKNILDHLVLALPWQQAPELLAEESLRYAEEAIRDAIAVVLTPQELGNGLQFDVYHNWQSRAPAFFRERYGSDGERACQAVEDIKARFRASEAWTADDAVAAWRSALSVWQVVWKKFTLRVIRELPEHAVWLTRVNAFV